MKVLIRVDSSTAIGWGHVYRCATLGAELKRRNAEVTAVCRDLAGNVPTVMAKAGIPVKLLPPAKTGFRAGPQDLPHADWLTTSWQEDAEQTLDIARKLAPDWAIVDHYSLDHRWEKMVGVAWRRLFVIDDTADRMHISDLLLDQNLHANIHSKYPGNVPVGCELLLGPKYALLREEFRQAKKRVRDGVVSRILVFFGGADPAAQTSKALRALQSLPPDGIAIDVVTGAANPFAGDIRRLAGTMQNVTIHHQVENMAELMGAADLAIGAPASATWERCCLGLPAITIAIADNQRPIGRGVAATGAVMDLGWYEDVSVEKLAAAVQQCLENPAQVREMSACAARLVDGQGAERVVDAMERYP